MDKKIKELIDELEKIENKLIENISKISINKNEINDKLIELISEYPEQKQLIKFIIYITDNLSLNQIEHRDILIDAITELIEKKRKILKIIEELHINKSSKSKKKIFFDFIKNIPLYGWVTISISFVSILVFLFLLIHPEKTETIVKSTEHIIISKKGKK